MKDNKNLAPVIILLIVLIIIAVGGIAYYAGKSSSAVPLSNSGVNNYQGNTIPNNTINNLPIVNNQSTNTSPVNPVQLKSYVNQKYGFSFNYPSSWSKDGNESEFVGDIKTGAIGGVNINFVDTASKTHFQVEYHLAPKGASLYNSLLSDYNSSQGWYVSGGKQIQVAGDVALESNTTLTVDGKGNPLSIPLQRTIVDFLDKNQTGEMELQLETPASNSAVELSKFNQLLASFKFN